MQKLIFILFLFFFAFSGIAQNNFPAPQVIVGNTIFKIKNGEQYSQIYNAANTSPSLKGSWTCGLFDADVTKIENAMRSVYVNNPHKLNALKNGLGSYKNIHIFLIVKPSTGQVLEMLFDLPTDTIITPAELLQIENKIKMLSFPQHPDCHYVNYKADWVVAEW